MLPTPPLSREPAGRLHGTPVAVGGCRWSTSRLCLWLWPNAPIAQHLFDHSQRAAHVEFVSPKHDPLVHRSEIASGRSESREPQTLLAGQSVTGSFPTERQCLDILKARFRVIAGLANHRLPSLSCAVLLVVDRAATSLRTECKLSAKAAGLNSDSTRARLLARNRSHNCSSP
jgi:hypothetical protein